MGNNLILLVIVDKGSSQGVNEWSSTLTILCSGVSVLGLFTVTLGTAGFSIKWKDEWKTVYMSFQVWILQPFIFSVLVLYVFAAGSHYISFTVSILNGSVIFYTNRMHIPQHDVIVYCVYHKTVTQVSISLVTPLLLYCTVY